jgi:ABC-type oligopeptide transport system ATPase subunit
MTYLTRSQINQVQESVVCINCGKQTGTGFFVLPGIIASCQHVIKDFKVATPQITWKQKNLTIKNINLPSNLDNPDLVLIEVELLDHPILPLESFQSSFSSVYSYGFQYTDRGYKGYGALGKNGDLICEEKGNQAQELILILQANIQPGLSGAPLFSLEDSKVIGIIKRNNPDGGGYAIPIERLEELIPGLIEENKKLTKATNISNELISQYFKQICAEHTHIKMIDLNRELRLEDIYVSLTIAPESVTGRRLNLDVTGRLSAATAKNITKIDVRRDLGSPQKYYLEREVTLQELISQRKVIILGEPGSGKTTLLRHLIVRLCKGEILVDKIPVFIKLSDLRREPGCVQQYLKASYEYVYACLEEAVARGNVVFFIDGLDEIPKDEHELIEREINRLAASQNQIFLTCRIAAFSKGIFSSDYRIYECIGFNPAQQKRFLKGWFSDRQDIASDVERQIRFNKGTLGFSRNPLLLSLMAIVIENDPAFTLPSQRIDLYSRTIELLIDRRQSIKGIKQISKRLKLDILKRLAFTLFMQGKEIFADEELLCVIDSYRQNSQALLGKEISSEVILEVLVEQDGVLARQTKSSCRFLHLTFQEYFTAQSISENKDWEKILSKKILDPRWEEVIRLLAGVFSANNSQKLLEIIWSKRSKDSFQPKWFSSFKFGNRKDLWTLDRLFLAGRCVSDTEHVASSYLNSLVSELLLYTFESDLDTQVGDATLALASVCSAHKECLEAIIAWFNQQASSQLTITLLFRYIQLLRLTISQTSLEELMRLFRYFISVLDRFDEAIVQIIGLLAEAIGNFGRIEPLAEISVLLSQNSSYLCATASQALSSTLAQDVEIALWQCLSSPKSLGYIPSAYSLFKYQESETNKKLISKAFSYRDDHSLQLLARQVVDTAFLEGINDEFILELLTNTSNDLSRSNLLSCFGLFANFNDDGLIENIIFDQNSDLVLRCSAIEAFIHLYPNRIDEFFEKLFTESIPITLLRIAISSLSRVGYTSVYSLLCKKIDASTEENIVLVLRHSLILG